MGLDSANLAKGNVDCRGTTHARSRSAERAWWMESSVEVGVDDQDDELLGMQKAKLQVKARDLKKSSCVSNTMTRAVGTSAADVYIDGLVCFAIAFLRGRLPCQRRWSFRLESLGPLLLAGPLLSL